MRDLDDLFLLAIGTGALLLLIYKIVIWTIFEGACHEETAKK